MTKVISKSGSNVNVGGSTVATLTGTQALTNKSLTYWIGCVYYYMLFGKQPYEKSLNKSKN